MPMKKPITLCTLAVLMVLVAFSGCASLPENMDRKASTAYQDTHNTRIGRQVQKGMAAHPGASGYLLLNDGLDAFVARVLLAQKAERSIDTQYYMIHDDVVGSLFVDQLFKAAQRGVRVRLLVDDIDQDGRDVGAAILDSHPNIEVRIFNPFGRNTGRTLQYLSGFGKQTRRAHNKSFTVDSQATILGGRNIGDEYFEADPDLAFVDLDVLAVGPVAGQVSASFDQYWNSQLSYPVASLVDQPATFQEIAQRKQTFDEFVARQGESEYMVHLRNSGLGQRIRQDRVVFHWGQGTVVADDPQKLLHDTSETKYNLSEQLRPYTTDIREELIIFSPYFVPGKSGVAFFKQLRDRGVRVKILTNSLASTDVGIVHAGYARYRKTLLRMGVELYELNQNLTQEQRRQQKEGGTGRSKSSLHAKCFVFDRETAFIGSLNLDPRSVVQNTEIGVVIESTAIAGRIAETFDENIDQAAFRLELRQEPNGAQKLYWHGIVRGEKQTATHEPYTGFWRRVGIGILRILPIESQI
jgi:putative cardiolipin synthase